MKSTRKKNESVWNSSRWRIMRLKALNCLQTPNNISNALIHPVGNLDRSAVTLTAIKWVCWGDCSRQSSPGVGHTKSVHQQGSAILEVAFHTDNVASSTFHNFKNSRMDRMKDFVSSWRGSIGNLKHILHCLRIDNTSVYNLAHPNSIHVAGSSTV